MSTSQVIFRRVQGHSIRLWAILSIMCLVGRWTLLYLSRQVRLHIRCLLVLISKQIQPAHALQGTIYNFVTNLFVTWKVGDRNKWTRYKEKHKSILKKQLISKCQLTCSVTMEPLTRLTLIPSAVCSTSALSVTRKRRSAPSYNIITLLSTAIIPEFWSYKVIILKTLTQLHVQQHWFFNRLHFHQTDKQQHLF